MSTRDQVFTSIRRALGVTGAEESPAARRWKIGCAIIRAASSRGAGK